MLNGSDLLFLVSIATTEITTFPTCVGIQGWSDVYSLGLPAGRGVRMEQHTIDIKLNGLDAACRHGQRFDARLLVIDQWLPLYGTGNGDVHLTSPGKITARKC